MNSQWCRVSHFISFFVLFLLGIDRYGFFRADADTDFFPSPLADGRLWTADFLGPIFVADTAFAPWISLLQTPWNGIDSVDMT